MSVLRANKAASYALTTLAAFPLTASAASTDLTGKALMEKMEPGQRASYVAGVVEGLAYARFARDDKKTEGMKCIYDWFYQKPETINVIYVAFADYPQFTPGAIISALVKKHCGE